MLNVSVYKHPDEFPSDLLQLFMLGEQENVEGSVPWYSNLINAVYPFDDCVRIYVLRKSGQPIAALPIRVKKSALGYQVESLSNYYTALYTPLMKNGLEVADMTVLISAVRAAYAPLTSMRFAPMDPESMNFATLFDALKGCGLVPYKFFRFGNWYHRVAEDWATYLKNRDGMVRSTIKRMGKKFLTDGGTLEIVQGGANLETGLAAYQQVYALSWKNPEPFPEFIPGLIRTCAAKGWLRLGVAWLNNEPVAAQLWIVANGRANIYKLAYDEKFKSYASGTLLTAMMMEYAINIDKVAEIDYLIGDDPYKKSWMSERRERWGLIAYNPRSTAGIWGLSREFLGRTAKLSRQR